MVNKTFSVRLFKAIVIIVFSGVACHASSGLFVYAEGQGVSQDAAIQSALRTAIEQHLGVLISGETLVKNHELVSQEITSYSKGFVKNYEIIDQTTEGSNYRVKLAAELLPEKINESVAKHSELKIDGSTDYINMQLEKERRTAARNITNGVIEKLIRAGYNVELEKVKYDTTNAESIIFSMNCKVTLNRKMWKETLTILKKLKTPQDSGFELVTGEYDQDNTPSFSIRDIIPVWLEAMQLFNKMTPTLLVQINGIENKPLFVRTIPLKVIYSGIISGSYNAYNRKVRFSETRMPSEQERLAGTPQFIPVDLNNSYEFQLSGKATTEEIKYFDGVKASMLTEQETAEFKKQKTRSLAYNDLSKNKWMIAP